MVDSARKLVSVVVPVFNGEATVAAAIESALAQEFEGDIEVMVVNDGSTDGTAKVLEGYRGRVTIVDRVNGGPAAARNSGVRVSHGDYLAFLDADDIWMPGKLAKTLAALDADPEAAMVYSNASIVAADGRPLGTSYTPVAERHAPALEDLLWGLWNILPSTAVMKRATFDAIGGFREEFAPGHPQWEDCYFMLVAREHGRFVYLDEPTVLYRTVATVREILERRRVWKDGAENPEAMRVERYTRNSELMERLVRERFGERGRRLIGAVRRATAETLVSVGLTAMLDYDRDFARRCYLLALQYDRFNPRTYVRIGWTYLPERFARALSGWLPPRLSRAVCGPAQA